MRRILRVWTTMHRGSLSAFSHLDTCKWSPPPNLGRGRLTEWLGKFIALISTFRSLFKASDTFDDFQVLTKMVDSHRNCRHHKDFKTLSMFWEHLKRYFHIYSKKQKETKPVVIKYILSGLHGSRTTRERRNNQLMWYLPIFVSMFLYVRRLQKQFFFHIQIFISRACFNCETLETLHSFFYFSIPRQMVVMVPGIPSGHRGNWG